MESFVSNCSQDLAGRLADILATRGLKKEPTMPSCVFVGRYSETTLGSRGVQRRTNNSPRHVDKETRMSPHCELMDLCPDFLEEELKLLENELSSQICELECVQSEVTDIKGSSYSNEFFKPEREVCSSSGCRNVLDVRLPSNFASDNLVYDTLRELYKNLSVRNSSIKCLKLDLMRLKKYLKIHKVRLRHGEPQESQFPMDGAGSYCLNCKCRKETEDTQTNFTSTESTHDMTNQSLLKFQEENKILKRCLSNMYQKLRRHILNDEDPGDCKDLDQQHLVEEDIEFLTKVTTGALDTFAQFHLNLQENIKQLKSSLSTQSEQVGDEDRESSLCERSALQKKRLRDFSVEMSKYPEVVIDETSKVQTFVTGSNLRQTQSAKLMSYSNGTISKQDENVEKTGKLRRELLFSQKQMEMLQTKIFEAIQLVYDVEMELDSDKDLVTMVTAIAEECNALRKEVGYLRKHRQDVKESWLSLQSYILDTEKTLKTNGRNVKTLKSIVQTLAHFLESSSCASLEETFMYLYSNQLEWIEKIENENSNDCSFTTKGTLTENASEEPQPQESASVASTTYKTIGIQTTFTFHPEMFSTANDNKCDMSVQSEDFDLESIKRTSLLFDSSSNSSVTREIYVLHETPEEADINEFNNELEMNSELKDNLNSESAISITPIEDEEPICAIKLSQNQFLYSTPAPQEISTENNLDSSSANDDDSENLSQNLTNVSNENEPLSDNGCGESDDVSEEKEKTVKDVRDSNHSSMSVIQIKKSKHHGLEKYCDFKTLERFFHVYDKNMFIRFLDTHNFTFDNFRIILPETFSSTEQPWLQAQTVNSVHNLTEDFILKGRKMLLSFLYSLGSEKMLSIERSVTSFDEQDNRKLYIQQGQVSMPLSTYEAGRKKIITTLKKAFCNKAGISEDMWMLFLSFIAPFTYMGGNQQTMDIARFPTKEPSHFHSIYLCNQDIGAQNFTPKSIFVNENILETNFVNEGIYGKIANLVSFLLFLLNEPEDCTYDSNYVLCKNEKPYDVSSSSFSNKVFDVYIESNSRSPGAFQTDCEAFFLVQTDMPDILTTCSKNELDSKLNSVTFQLGAHAKGNGSGHLKNYMLRVNDDNNTKHFSFENMCLKLSKHRILHKAFEFFHIPSFSSELDISLVAVNIINIREEANETKVKLYPVDDSVSEMASINDANPDDAQGLTLNAQHCDDDDDDDGDQVDSILSHHSSHLSDIPDDKSSIVTQEDSHDEDSGHSMIEKESAVHLNAANSITDNQSESILETVSNRSIESKCSEKHIRQDIGLREMSLLDEISALKDNLEQQNAVLLRLKEDLDETSQALVQKEKRITELQEEITTLQGILATKEEGGEDKSGLQENETQTDLMQGLEINRDLEIEVEKLRHEKIQFLLKSSSQKDVIYSVKSQLQASISHLVSLKREAASQLKKQKSQLRDVIQVKRQLCESKDVITNLRNDLESKNDEMNFIKDDCNKHRDKIYVLQQKLQNQRALLLLAQEKSRKREEHGSQTELVEDIEVIKKGYEKDEPNLFQEGQSNLFPELLTKLRNMESLYFQSKEGSPEIYDDSDDSELIPVKDKVSNRVKDKDWSKLLSISEEAYLNLVSGVSKCLKLDHLKGSKLMSSSSLSVNEDIAVERKYDLQNILEALRAVTMNNSNGKDEFGQDVCYSDKSSPRRLSGANGEHSRSQHKLCSAENHCQCFQNALQDTSFRQHAVKNSYQRKTSLPKSGKNGRHILCHQRNKVPLELKNAKILASLDKSNGRN